MPDLTLESRLEEHGREQAFDILSEAAKELGGQVSSDNEDMGDGVG